MQHTVCYIRYAIGIVETKKVVSKLPEGFLLCNFEALGCGAVFYVAVIEILPDAIKGSWKNTKYLTVLAGIAIVAFIQISHSHSHEDHEHHFHNE